MLRSAFFFVPFFCMLCGCQQAAWKAGASADDFKRDEHTCREQGRDEASVAQCLRNKGWALANFNAQAEGETIPTETSAPPAESISSPLTENVRNLPDSNSQTSAGTKPETATLKSGKAITSTDPLQRQSVQTWWKAGANAADFQIDAERCLTQLGEQHLPDYSKRLYTRGMVNCLRQQGWYAGGDPVYTPLR